MFILATSGVVGLYPSLPQKVALQTLKDPQESRRHKIPTDKLVKMFQFVLQNNLFDFNKIVNFISCNKQSFP